MKFILISLIKLYWLLIPKHKRRKCLFKKSCSSYVYDVTKTYGLISGLKALKFRINNCNPQYRIIEVKGETVLITKSLRTFRQKDLNQSLIEKRWMKKIATLLILILTAACSGPTKKSIFEELSMEELKNELKKDTLFEKTYKLVKFATDSLIKDEIERIKWSDLTYKRVHELVLLSIDTTFLNPQKEIFFREWQNKFLPILEDIDSTSNYWKDFRDENSLEKYVDIELVSIDKEYYSYSYGIKNINLGFRLTPLKGKIDQMRFSYLITSKLEEDDKTSYLSILDKNWCRMSRPFSKPTVRYWKADYSDEKKLESRNVETLFRDYNVLIKIDEIRIDGFNLNEESLNIPKSIKNYWKYEDLDYLSDLYAEDVASELLGKKYHAKSQYVNSKVDSIIKSKDSIAYNFLNLK